MQPVLLLLTSKCEIPTVLETYPDILYKVVADLQIIEEWTFGPGGGLRSLTAL